MFRVRVRLGQGLDCNGAGVQLLGGKKGVSKLCKGLKSQAVLKL